MSFPQDALDEMKTIFAGLSTASEGNVALILIPNLQLPAGCEPSVVDALLCPTGHYGYSSRLLLSSRVSHKGLGQNWNCDRVILGRRWFAVSWTLDPVPKRLLQLVLAHLEAFKCK